LEELKKDLVLCSHENKQIKFKLEPCILHVACRDLNCAQKLFDKAKFVGWKKSGIITAKNHIILELNSTERLEFPIISLGEILVDDKFLKIIVKETNRKLEKSWEKIEKLEMAINNYSTKNKNL
jgi:tRNA wybutosine-synthesizing protein 3